MWRAHNARHESPGRGGAHPDELPGGSEIFVATIFDPTDGVGDLDHVDPTLRLWKPLPLWPDGLRTLAAFNTHIREAAAARTPIGERLSTRGALLHRLERGIRLM
jgi:hypothetical protein